MKQINNIPVRRRPQSKDIHPGADEDQDAASADQPRQRRQIWDQLHSASGAPPSVEMPAPKPPRPQSTPLILRNSTPAPDGPSEADETPAPPAAVAPTPGQPDVPAAQSRPVSRPRTVEPPADIPQPSSARPRSRPIMSSPRADMPAASSRAEPASPQPDLPDDAIPVPAATVGAPTARQKTQPVNRAKTRIIGFHAQDIPADPMAGAAKSQASTSHFPTGWFVIVEGPGRGASFALCAGVSTIGRAEDQAISLDFGDMSVSRSTHASVAYDEETKQFFIGHGGKSNVVRRNGSPVLATEELQTGDLVRIGKTTLRFVALCGKDFTWDESMHPTSTEGRHG
ncbi:MAG: FHA domain-containing protein [Pseudomonadota bacterium]